MAAREKGGLWVNIAAAVFYPVTWLARRITRDAGRIPQQGGAILVFNHISHLDPVVDAVFVHQNKRVPRFLAKDSLFRIPVAGKIVGGAGTIPVYRGTSNAADSLRAANQALQEGKIVVIYPEGTITKDPTGWPMRSFPGVARLADDPFARIFPASILRVGPGVVGVTTAPVGPTIERYGSANPWPWDRFDLGGGS